MSKLVVAMHVSLDGFVAGIHGEMDWIAVDEALFDFVGTLTAGASAALYGRNTFEMMNSYWPTAADGPNASRHDVEHAAWYNAVTKYVLSDSMTATMPKVEVVRGEGLAASIAEIKQRESGNIVIFGSPRAVHTLLRERLIDEIHLFVNPVVLGQGIPMFEAGTTRTSLALQSSRVFDTIGVVYCAYARSA